MPLTSSCKRAIVPTALALLALPTVMPTNAAETPGGGSIELRGLHRARYERLSPQYRAGLGGSDTVLALQTSLVLEANWPKLSFMGELLDARAELNDSDSVFAGVVNTLEPIQNIDTWSMRVFRPVERSRINYEIEAGIQRGDSAAGQSNPLVWLEHDAYYAHAEIGYAPDLAWTPNILLQYDVASGDRDPTDNKNERFNPLFGERRFDTGPTSIYGAFQRSNIASPGVRVTFNPAPRWRAMVAYRDFKLDAARDAWVGSGWRDPTGQAGSSLGRQLEGSATWNALADRLTIEAGLAHTHMGRFARQTAGAAFRGSPDYFYAGLAVNF